MSMPSSDELLTAARKALREVVDDEEAPAAARVQAARTLLEMVGALGRHQQEPQAAAAKEETRDLAGLSREELLAELARIRRKSGTKSS